MVLSKQCKALTLEWKAALIKEIKRGGRTKSSIAKEFSIATLTLSTVLKNKDEVIDGVEKTFSRKKKRIQNSKFPDVEAAHLQRLENVRVDNLPVISLMIMKGSKKTLQKPFQVKRLFWIWQKPLRKCREATNKQIFKMRPARLKFRYFYYLETLLIANFLTGFYAFDLTRAYCIGKFCPAGNKCHQYPRAVISNSVRTRSIGHRSYLINSFHVPPKYKFATMKHVAPYRKYLENFSFIIGVQSPTDFSGAEFPDMLDSSDIFTGRQLLHKVHIKTEISEAIQFFARFFRLYFHP